MPTYEIIIKNETAEDKKSPIADSSSAPSVQNTSPGSSGTANFTSAASKAAGAYFAFKKIVAPFVNQSIQHGISTISLRTGQNEQQQRIQFAYDMGKQAFSILESVAVGAATGGVAGAVAGAVMGIATTIYSVAQAQDTINMKGNLEDISRGLINARAGGGIATNGSR